MPILRLTQHGESQPDHYRVEVELTGDGLPRQTAEARFDFKLTDQDQEALRWYLEDFLQQAPHDPAPAIAARIEARMAEIGVGLFKAVFHADDDARDLWATLREHLDETRVEVITTDVRQAAAIPWELIRDPKTDVPLALRAPAFVRAHPQAAQHPHPRPLPRKAREGSIRILLVICRPGGGQDVPFRSVASRLVKGLSDDARALFQLDVLRPPTFERLSEALRQAKAAGRPYHVVHFDGHGLYLETPDPSAAAKLLKVLSPLLLSGTRAGAHGYLAFENPQVAENLQLADGPALGQLLVETGVPVLVLNACRSAYADPAPTPNPSPVSPPLAGEGPGERSDPHAQTRAFGTLAQEVMDAGVAGVVAMRYNVYVVTAAQFVADLYAALAQGQTLGEAATQGRKQLAAQPLREIAYDPRPLQDWPVPVVYEAAPLPLFPKPAKKTALTIALKAGDAAPTRGALDPSLPPAPDVGFYGRDETLLALDRAFDTQSIVLLHAYAGSGKTATAAEFARWYALTGGVAGPVLFTSFEQYRPLPRVLDAIEAVFGPALEQAGVHWLALSDDARHDVALQVLAQIPVLWIWDNVEPVAGFPAGTPSAWTDAEQRTLADFLRAARGTRARFLLTSRRDERGWLGDLPARIPVPPMPFSERVQLARALAEKHGRRLPSPLRGEGPGVRGESLANWIPLLQFTQGNPLAITVLVGQALRDGLKTREQVEAFVEKLRAGQAAFNDEAEQGRARSLGASLGYGFTHAFAEEERRQLALLHFFQGFVQVGALQAMGHPDAPWCLLELRGLTCEVGIALLDRAAEIGLLMPHGSERGSYLIHPALPWFFKGLFGMYYPGAPIGELPSTVSNPQSATFAFVAAMGWLGNVYHHGYSEGNNDVIYMLGFEEANLLYAKRLARVNAWWDALVGTMQGLRAFYEQTGRRVEWKRLVDEVVQDFTDPVTDGPLAGREDGWRIITSYRVLLAREARQSAVAEHLQRALIVSARQYAAPVLAVKSETFDPMQYNAVQTLAVALEGLGHILREQNKPECVGFYQEATELYQYIGAQRGEALAAYNLARAYQEILALPYFVG